MSITPDPVTPAPVANAPSRVIALNGAVVREGPHQVAVEVPVRVSFADVPFAVMMLTPTDLVDFAYGFSLTEGIVEQAEQIRSVEVETLEDGLGLRIALAGSRLHKHLARQRAMTGRTGCGICGIDDIEALRRARSVPAAAPRVAVEAVARALRDLDNKQSLNLETRAVHGAAWADNEGAIQAVREDVGRHNALDKLIGAMLRAGTAAADGFVIITSRCSFEMVEKTATFGARTLVAISAPTSFAIERARALDLTLIAIARRDTLAVFHGTERVA